MAFLIQFSGGENFDGFSGPSLLLLAAGAALGGAWLALGIIRWFATRPRLPRPGPATMDMGLESPAIVNFLVNRCHVTSAAMSATLVDLAAQRKLGIDMLDLKHGVVRLRQGAEDTTGLRPYEKQVLEFVRSRATGGSAPLEALELDDAGTATAWKKRFSKSVTNEARKLGLARDRWSRFDYTWLIFGLLAAIELVMLAFGTAHLFEQTGGTDDDFDRWDWLWVGAIAWFVICLGLSRLRSLRETTKGREVAARWLGVQKYLRENPALEDVPPAAVTVWERVLSAGVALGAAHATTEALPFEADDPETAWTRRTGVWRLIRIEYPKRFGFGEAPWKATLIGLARAVFFGALAFVLLPTLVPILFDLRDEFDEASGTPENYRYVVFGVLGTMSLLGAYWALMAFTATIRFVRGALDLGKTKVVEGEVVQTHLGRVAVDEGREDEVVAWTPPAAAPGLRRGMVVRAVMSPRLHHVRSVEVLSTEGAASLASLNPDPDELLGRLEGFGRVLGSAAPVTVDLEAVRLATGITLHTVNAAAGAPVAVFETDTGDRVMVTRHGAGAGILGRVMGTAIGMVAGETVRDVPNGRWVNGIGLVVNDGGHMLSVAVEIPGMSDSERRLLATEVARNVQPTP